MATTRIGIENGKIAWHDGRYFEYLSEDGRQFVGNGWHVCIDTDANVIHCWSARQYSTGWAVYEKVYKLADGLIGLSGGDVRQRYSYFRSAKLQRFLYEHNISAVERVDPNGEYTLKNCRTGCGVKRNSIRTDGAVEELELRTDDWTNTCAWESEKTIRITGASWVIVDSYINYGDSHNEANVLRTLQNVLKIRTIPNEEKRRQWHRDLRKAMESLTTSSKEQVVGVLEERRYRVSLTPYATFYWERMKEGATLKVNRNYDDCDHAEIIIVRPGSNTGDTVLRVYPEEGAFMD